MKIYTKTGDRGKTVSFDQTPTSKHSIRIHAIGSIDELNSSLGVIASLMSEVKVQRYLELVQRDLFRIGSYLSGKEDEVITASRISFLEEQIDEWDAQLPTLTNFILPGGSHTASLAHQARSICRRAERELVGYHDTQSIEPTVLQYINRLSDWLFMLARYINIQEGSPEKTWNQNVS